MRVLVTGTRGFVGAAIACRLMDLGHDVVGAVRRRELGAREVFLDLAERAPIRDVPRDFDAVVHCAAVVDGALYSRNTIEVNAGGTRRLATWAREVGVAHFIHVSSIAAYGLACVGEDRREGTTRLGRFPLLPAYLLSKAEAERHVVASDVPHTILRLPAVLGAGDTIVTPAIVQALNRREVPWMLRRDRRVSTLWSRNAAEVVAAVLDHGPLMGAFNVTDGEVPWDVFVGAFAAELGCAIVWRRVGARASMAHADDIAFLYLVLTGSFGAHFPSDKLRGALPDLVLADWRDGVREAVAAYDPSRTRTGGSPAGLAGSRRTAPGTIDGASAPGARG